jgi:uncharacterized protein (TIGR03086 family)
MRIDVMLDLDRRAVEETLAVLGGGGDYDRRTPCADWTLGDLLAHMTVQQRGFAAAARGRTTTLADWQPRPLGADPVSEYADACAEVLAAFASLDDPATPMHLPEIRDEPVPAGLAVGFHLVDNVVHAWDVAASLGAPCAFDDEVLAAGLDVARKVPDGVEREREGAAFAHARAVPESAGVLDQILLLLGREPGWRPSAG